MHKGEGGVGDGPQNFYGCMHDQWTWTPRLTIWWGGRGRTVSMRKIRESLVTNIN